MAVQRGRQVVGLQLDGGEAVGPRRQVGHAAVARRGVGQRHQRAGVQKAVGRQQVRRHGQAHAHLVRRHRLHHDAQVPGQPALAAAVEISSREIGTVERAMGGGCGHGWCGAVVSDASGQAGSCMASESPAKVVAWEQAAGMGDVISRPEVGHGL